MYTFVEGFKYDDQYAGIPDEREAFHQKLWSELVPRSGKCDTVNGELLRAANKICYDYYNNGWNCNNWSGAVIYLRNHFFCADDPNGEAGSDRLRDALNHAYLYSHGELYEDEDRSVDYSQQDVRAAACFAIMKEVLDWIEAHPEPKKNEVDIYDLSEPDVRY